MPERLDRDAIKGLIEKELGDFNKVHPGVSTSPLVRLRQYIARHNELVDRASVSINGVDVTRAELDEAKLQVPNFAKDCVVYSATASTKAKGMSLTVVY